MFEDLNEPASVQYGDWKGTFSGDEIDHPRDTEAILGVDIEKWRLIAIDLLTSGGSQWLSAYGVPAKTSYADFEAMVDNGQKIGLTRVAHIEFELAQEDFDTNPPPPESRPVKSPMEFLAHGFKRSNLRMLTRNLPPGAELEIIGDIVEPED